MENVAHLNFADMVSELGKQPLKAIDAWAARLLDGTHMSRTTCAIAMRQLSQLRRIVPALKLSPDEEMSIETSLALVGEALERCAANADIPYGSRSAFLSGMQSFVSSRKLDPIQRSFGHEYSESDLRDLELMEKLASTWSKSEQFIRWVERGYRRVRSGEGSILRAFAPLKIFPGGDPAKQFSLAFKISDDIGFSWPKGLLTAVLEELSPSGISDTEALLFHRELWRVIALIEPDSAIVSTGRSYLRQLQISGSFGEVETSSLVEALVEAIAASKPSGSAQAKFFDTLLKSKFWKNIYSAHRVSCWLEEMERGGQRPEHFDKKSVEESWQLVLSRYLEKGLSEYLSCRNDTTEDQVFRLLCILDSGRRPADKDDAWFQLSRLLELRNAEVSAIYERERELLVVNQGGFEHLYEAASQ